MAFKGVPMLTPRDSELSLLATPSHEIIGRPAFQELSQSWVRRETGTKGALQSFMSKLSKQTPDHVINGMGS
jgi:hypothetical protein